MSDSGQAYKGHWVFGVAVGTEPPYQSYGGIEIELAPGWGCWVEQTAPEGQYTTEDEAQEAGRQCAREFVDLNPHLLPIPKKGQDES